MSVSSSAQSEVWPAQQALKLWDRAKRRTWAESGTTTKEAGEKAGEKEAGGASGVITRCL